MSTCIRETKDIKLTHAILIYPNFEKEFILDTDASGSGIGAENKWKGKSCLLRQPHS